MKKPKSLTNYTDERILEVIFFLFGFSVMSWVPRLPEIKDHLGVNDGQFGTLLSAGAIGALASLLTMGHAVNHLGSAKIIRLGFTVNLIAYVAATHVKNPFIFLLLNIAIGFGVSTIHLAANSQVFADQRSLGRKIIPRMHGVWAIGALLTTITSSLLIGRVSLTIHMGILMAVSWVLTLLLVQLRIDTLLKPNEVEKTHFSISNIFKSFRIDFIASAGLLCAQLIEFSTNDWSAIFARDAIGVSGGLTALTYVTFVLAMIAGRLGARRIELKLTLTKAVRIFGFFGGLGFGLCVLASKFLVEEHKYVALAVSLLGFAIAGFGSSFLGPTFTNAAIHRSDLPNSVVVGQLGVINNILVLTFKTIIAWTAQLTSLFFALLIPGFLLMIIGLFAGATKSAQAK